MQITGLRPAPFFPTSLTAPIALGGGSFLLGILYSTVSGSGQNPVGVACILDRDLHLTEIGASDPTRKDAGLTVWQDGTTARMIVSEADVPGGGGNTTALYTYEFPDALPLPLPTVDQPARQQANAATGIAKAAQASVDTLRENLHKV